MDPVATMLAERECERLVLTYALYIDEGQAQSAADLFTPDGVWESEKRRWAGHEEVSNGFRARQRLRRRACHVCTNILITLLSETEATGTTDYLLFRKDGRFRGSVAPLDGQLIVGRYYDRFVLTPQGWRFAHRRAAALFSKRRRQVPPK